MEQAQKWIRTMTRFGQHAEMLQTQQQHPSMQNLFKAIELVGATLKDHHWVLNNDPDRNLDQVLTTLIKLTNPKDESVRPLS